MGFEALVPEPCLGLVAEDQEALNPKPSTLNPKPLDFLRVFGIEV